MGGGGEEYCGVGWGRTRRARRRIVNGGEGMGLGIGWDG